MAKSIYRIRASLNRSILDYEPPIAFSSGIKIVRPMKVLFFWMISALSAFGVIMGSPVAAASLPWKILLAIWWIVATMVLAKYSKTKEMRLSSLVPLWQYLPRSARHVTTRRDSPAYPFREITGLKKVHDSGLIEFVDGSVGQAYLVVGSGSVLLFEEDRRLILDRAEQFWRRADRDAEFISITTKEPQRVGSQLKHINDLRAQLEVADEDLVDLLHERFEVMRTRVGDKLSSVHQYFIIKADNLEVLRRAHADLASELEASQLFLKQCSMLDGASFLEMMRFFYQFDHARLQK